jgi:uncharacterized membrane protein YedE/YeeE
MLLALLGGALIGLGASVLWVANARIAGVTGLLHNALRGSGPARRVSLAFLLGLVSAGALLDRARPDGKATALHLGTLAVAGVLVGFGTRLGGGCTSGHGVCGVARLSPRSIVATLTFMATGVIAVFLTHHAFHWIGGAE